MSQPYSLYIGKAQSPEGMEATCHLLPYHFMDVAAVGAHALDACPRLEANLAGFLNIEPVQFRALFLFGLLLHDLGKMTSSFQSVFESSGLVKVDLPEGVSYDGKRGRHDQLGYDVWKKVQKTTKITGSTLREKRRFQFFLGIFWGHHGKPVRQEKTIKDTLKLTPQDIAAAEAWINDCQSLVGAELPTGCWTDDVFSDRLKQVSWLLAGLATYCDWVGSDSDVFTYHDQPIALEEYWHQVALPAASLALAKTEVFDPVTVLPFNGFQSLFPFDPSPLQSYAEKVAVSASPQLFILEDLTGSGKTEAALTLAHRLLASGAGRGLYFGLPTMATSNAMFDRVSEHYHKMLAGAENAVPSIVLAHGARNMNDRFREAMLGESNTDQPYEKGEATASLHCNQWLADSRKKALLAPVGVGTIDQVLLAILPKRHQSLRVLGLYGKVLILDEVHAADEYMLVLLGQLMRLHASQGGSIILLTATLPQAQRQRLVNAWQRALGQSPYSLQHTGLNDFPLATRVAGNDGVQEKRLPCRKGTEKQITVDFIYTEAACVEHIVAAVEHGQCAVWIRNSVDEAVSAYRQLRERLSHPENCQLFHSRFVLQHRKDREAWVMQHFGKSSTQEQRMGRVLIATQVFQESLDADTDVMISDLCLIDDLVQRAGRLHRHTRDETGSPISGQPDGRNPPRLLIHAPPWDATPKADWLKSHSPNTQYVYKRPGRIWRTMEYLRDAGEIRLPEASRTMIESVYGEEVTVPEAFDEAELEYSGLVRASSNQGQFNCLVLEQGYTHESNRAWGEDNVDIGTRLGEESEEVVLVRRTEFGYEPYIKADRDSVELSVVKLSGKRLKQLQALTEDEKEAFVLRHRRAKYARVADVEATPYSEQVGWGSSSASEAQNND
ncbi:CRISPR-associated helicase Cas3' [Gilvimarinus agarilyticus]|uniref:CRISPR-associated helicase Cas3' n=1 Tax=Gilvimarinus sp. 2_MG-2023 TaxID=3062666 RepID=UPI001C07FCBA|nr:CRISPR-associated helicase Cas3' [Gilvimarinus sp. 2_MG-2023]MBU2885473.1 CRISPR-associated helicase Cas3' [Gilvimarinus agarilyticus]MDO6570373.1 CRISPR-associated helicase Cas3' [Gilvimarinus sp. 2_MG-2023]